MPKSTSKLKVLPPFPKLIKFSKIIGPSFIILAFGLGSGELILWPYLTSNYGLGIVWAALLGLTCQYFINMEIERYALVRGESVFVGLNRHLPKAAYWFITSTFIGFGLPGIVAAAAKSLSYATGIEDYKWLAIGLLILFGFILSAGTSVYRLMEKLTKMVILIAVPILLLLVVMLVQGEHIVDFWQGLRGIGKNYSFIPSGISLATFLAAFAYSGAGGNLNLAQSIYIKEKGYGMGAYSSKISGLFRKGHIDSSVSLEGQRFAPTAENINRYKSWWKSINLEHGLVFGLLGFVAMALLMILSYSTTYGAADNQEGIAFIKNQSQHIALVLSLPFGTLFLVLIGLLLSQTQLGILDSTSRIMAENAALKKIENTHRPKVHLSKIYFIFLWAQITFGVILFLLDFKEPKQLIVLGAVINAWAMIVHIALVYYLNHKELAPEFRPAIWRKIVLILIFIIFLGFGIVTLWSNLIHKL
ncbi:MAG TPA: Nramp family divalent metal transporter [bacterium]|nr:Nramp family divalent metal transporter [bacterium]